MKAPLDVQALSQRANKLNPRKITKQQQDNLNMSLAEFGDLSGVVYNRRTSNLVGGHQRVEIFKAENPQIVSKPHKDKKGTVALGYFEANGTRFVYREVDWPADKERAAMIAANKHGGDWDTTLLAQLMKDAPDSAFPIGMFGFSDQELSNLLDSVRLDGEPTEKVEAGDLIDQAVELQKKWKVQFGDVYDLGNHVIACADSKDGFASLGLSPDPKAEWQAAMCWTDPPWNVALGTSMNRKGWSKRMRPIMNDNAGKNFPKLIAAWFKQIASVVVQGGAIYVAMSPQELGVTDRELKEAGFHWSSTIIWGKDSLVFSRKDYHAQYEPIWYGWRDGKPRAVPLKDRKQSDLWIIPRPKRSELHPTMKPVALVKRAILNSSLRGTIVLDPFLGSGTTVIACEEAERLCFGHDKDPKFIAVTLERLTNLGLKPKLRRR